ncbi:MAG: response regulator transcription factor [Oscillospiraceae bacterium]|nr:response regulator transcription factor [Oscillospiraceae bacterium]
MNILVCDDDREIAAAIAVYLEHEGYTPLLAYNGREALELAASRDIQLIIMDVMMPVMDGIAATLELRKRANIPVIMLSAKSEDTDKIIGLNMGADDYVTKPFNPLELIARVKSQLRRYTSLGSKLPAAENVYTQGGLTVDGNLKQVSVDGAEIHVTPLEYKLLYLLISNPGRVFSMEEIYSRVWEDESYSVENTVSVHIRRLRAKIEIEPKDPKYIKVVWGIGYKMEKLDGK